jgi:hypothetical protein
MHGVGQDNTVYREISDTVEAVSLWDSELLSPSAVLEIPYMFLQRTR